MNVSPSLIVTTYNWPEALEHVLASIKSQTVLPSEVIIADDGSQPETTELLTSIKPDFPCPLVHIWQKDEGFQAAKIRNKAVSISTGDYIIFTDGDCLLRPDFIQNHRSMANENYFVAGNRILLSEEFTHSVLTENINITAWRPDQYQKDDINRPWALLRLPLGIFRKMQRNRWKGAKTCNLSLTKKAFEDVNGFNEKFHGWGYEDSDLVIRLLKRGYRHLNGKFSTTVLHCWHNENDRELESKNWEQLMAVKNSINYFSEQGVNQYKNNKPQDFAPETQ